MVASTAVEVNRPRAGSLGTEAAAALLAVVADPNRLAVLQALTAGTTCVCRLQEQVPIAANLLSYHLKVLREAGLIASTKRGRWVDYRLADGALDRLHAALPAPAAGSATDPVVDGARR
ncbi:MAG TPA: metalloregulator ArsR/SmtB family transcription factor [Kineosporiaceae bacterium]